MEFGLPYRACWDIDAAPSHKERDESLPLPPKILNMANETSNINIKLQGDTEHRITRDNKKTINKKPNESVILNAGLDTSGRRTLGPVFAA